MFELWTNPDNQSVSALNVREKARNVSKILAKQLKYYCKPKIKSHAQYKGKGNTLTNYSLVPGKKRLWKPQIKSLVRDFICDSQMLHSVRQYATCLSKARTHTEAILFKKMAILQEIKKRP